MGSLLQQSPKFYKDVFLFFRLKTFKTSKRVKTMADKLMYIPNVKTKNYPFYRIQLLVEMFINS